MKALTPRQEAALKRIQNGGTADKGMIQALRNKGYLGAATAAEEASKPAVANEKYVIYNPEDNNRMVRKPGKGAWVMDNAIFATEGAAKAFLTRSQRKYAQARLEGKRPSSYLAELENWVIVPMSEYLALDTMVERTNMMSGKKYMEDVNTPNYCSPSSEAYWSM